MLNLTFLRLTALAGVLATAAFLAGLPANQVAAGGGGCHGGPEREGAGSRVELSGNCFSPIVLNAEPGTTITFENMDDVQHDIAGAGAAWGTGGQFLGKGGTASVTFTEPGLYPYSCYLHYGMTGVIAVGDDHSVAGWAPGEMSVSRLPASASNAAQAAAVQTEDGSGDELPATLLIGGAGVLVAAAVASTIAVKRARR